MPIPLGLIEFDAVLSVLADEAPLLLQVGGQCFARLHLARLPGRLVLSTGGTHHTVGEMSEAVATLLDTCPPLLPVHGRDDQGREFLLSILVRELPSGMALQSTGAALTSTEIRSLPDN